MTYYDVKVRFHLCFVAYFLQYELLTNPRLGLWFNILLLSSIRQYHCDLTSVNTVCSHVTFQFDFSCFPAQKMHNEPISYAYY